MQMLSAARSTVFTLCDLVKGSPIGQVVKELDSIAVGRRDIGELQQAKIQALLTHAIRTVPFYQSYKASAKLSDFPVVGKRTIRDNYQSFLSSGFARRTLRTVTTGGSYGTPMTFYLSREKSLRRQAEALYFNAWAGYKPGLRMACFMLPRHQSGMRRWMYNQEFIDPTYQNDSWAGQQAVRLSRGDVRFILGYPSALQVLSEYAAKNRIDLSRANIRGVVAIGENLTEEGRALISGVFGCPVLSRYACEELGIIAHQCEKGNFHVNEAGFIVELLRLEEDTPVRPGEVGRIVVTDLHAFAMPLIRYETGDIATAGGDCSCGLSNIVLARLEGRVLEMITDTEGRRMSSMLLARAMNSFPELRQWQFVQYGMRDYNLNVMAFDGCFPEDRVKAKLLAVLGQDANISLNYVEDIPPLPSGKRPLVLNRHVTRTQLSP